MGWEDRDYNQHSAWNTSWGSETPVTKRLLIITVVVFLMQSLMTRPTTDPQMIMKFHSTHLSYVDEWFMLDAPAVLQGQVWRIVTYAFCHERQAAFSLVFNMLGLWFMGRRLELMYGSREFLLFYLAAAAAGGILYSAIGIATPLPIPMSGAYPPVIALFALYAIHYPYEQILFWFVPIQIRVLLFIIIGLDTYQVLQAVRGDQNWMIAAQLATHLSGAAFAFVYHRLNWRLSSIQDQLDFRKWRSNWRRASVSRQLRVYDPTVETDDLDTQVDAILAKIHEHGSESLTPSERTTLARASERAKKRL